MQARAKEAGKLVVPSRREQYEGKTIAQIAEMGDEGTKYLRWCLDPARQWEENEERRPILEAARTYVQIMLPDLWESVQAEHAQEK
jgi:hypothetical protein